MVELPDGSRIAIGDGCAPERACLRIRERRAFSRLLLRGEMGAAESYEAGEWDSDDLTAVFRLFLRNLPHLAFESPLTRAVRIPDRLRHLARRNYRRGAQENIHAHYDLGNDFFALFLGENWSYSCAVFESADQTLEAAQQNKLERLCQLLDLGARDHLLDIGCGWGELAIHAARTRRCRVTGITVSRQQLELARERVGAAGVADRVDIQFCDYRDATGHFDKIAAVEMIEAVGAEFLPTFFSQCAARLGPGGRLALQAITMPEERFGSYQQSVDWMQTYIFPGSLIPSVGSLVSAAGRAGGLRLVRFEEIGHHYAATLRTWRQRLAQRRLELERLGKNEAFWRRWELYLSFSEASFAERSLGDAQMVFEPRSAAKTLGR
jgi:cyclopropane-fatty-acyl-phospholipid synthase